MSTNNNKPNLDVNQSVSSHLAFILILVIGAVAAWYVVSLGQDIIRNSYSSEAFNLDKRINDNMKKK